MLLIGSITLLGLLFRSSLDYHIIAIAFLSSVGIMAITFRMVPILITCLLSALLLNYFFIPPYHTLHISNPNDILLLLIFLVIAVVHSILTFKIRAAQKQAMLRLEKERALQLYSNVFASLSHELKTPLATILASSDMLLHPTATLTTEQQTVLLQEITIAGNRLHDQVGNLLNMNRIEQGMITVIPVWTDPNELLLQVLNPLYSSAMHTFRFTEDNQLPFIKTDEVIMREVIHNLVINAIKHNSNPCTIHISQNIIQDKCWHIQVSDTGKGVRDDEIPQLFEKFYRGETAPKGGSGLGLALVKGYLDVLSGEIQVVKNEFGGLTFDLYIPVETSYINKLNIE